MDTKYRRLLWVVSVIVAFIVGYLLARRMCPERTTSSGAGGAISPNAGGQEAGAGAAAGSTASAASASGAAGGDGGPTSPNGRGGNAPGNVGAVSGAGGKSAAGGGDDRSAPSVSDSGRAGATANTGAPTPGGSPGAIDSSSVHAVNTRGAPDFSLDATGLPRYPNSVTKVASTLTLHPDAPGDSSSRCVIVTTDSFDTVKQWYHTHLPANWHEQSAADVQKLANQVSPENIMKMLGAAMQGGSTTASAPAPPSSPSGVPQLSVATWSAPDDGAHSERQVIVKGIAGQPTQVDMGRTVRP